MQTRKVFYKFIFFAHNGPGPWKCHFCDGEVTVDWVTLKGLGRGRDALAIHHLDGDHTNDHPDNIVGAHHRCHAAYHAKLLHTGMKRSVETRQRISTALTGRTYSRPGWDKTPVLCECGKGPFKGQHGLKLHRTLIHV